MVNVELLKVLTTIAEKIQKMEPIDSNTSIVIDCIFNNHKLLEYSFNVLNIPFNTDFNSRTPLPIEEINCIFCFDFGVNIGTMYQLVYVLYNILEDKLVAHIKYEHKPFRNTFNPDHEIESKTDPEEMGNEISIGTCIHLDYSDNGYSSPIHPNDILKLKIDEVSWDDIARLFPEFKYSSNENNESECDYDNDDEDGEYNEDICIFDEYDDDYSDGSGCEEYASCYDCPELGCKANARG